MTESEYPDQNPRASVSKRELRNLARRLAPSDRPELRAVARVLDKIASGEACTRPHHDGHDYDPFRCPECLPDLWVMYAIGVVFPNADAADLGFRFAGLLGLSLEDIALGVDAGRTEGPSPDVTHAWLALTDRQRDELNTVRAELGTHSEIEALLAQVRADHARDARAFIAARSPYPWLSGDGALLHEIRFGSDPRKARALKRKSLRAEMDLSCLMH